MHRMYTTYPSHASDGRRQSAVIPLSDFVLACHLAPQFPQDLRARSEPSITLNGSTDILSHRLTFFFNHYANYYTWNLVNHWRKFLAEHVRAEKEQAESERSERRAEALAVRASRRARRAHPASQQVCSNRFYIQYSDIFNCCEQA
jgi:hypothetical protein